MRVEAKSPFFAPHSIKWNMACMGANPAVRCGQDFHAENADAWLAEMRRASAHRGRPAFRRVDVRRDVARRDAWSELPAVGVEQTGDATTVGQRVVGLSGKDQQKLAAQHKKMSMP
jgi:hypothetical protein